MSRLFVPPKVARELQNERLEFAANLARMSMVMDDFNRELKQIDPYLELIRAKENPEVEVEGLKPGYWHILRHNPGAPPSVICVEGPNGEFLEPGSCVFDLLARNDMWSSSFRRDRERREREAKDAAARRRAREDEDRRTELFERLAAVSRTQVSMNTQSRWSQNVAGRRGVKGQ